MKPRLGTMLLSVISLLIIGGAFEAQRYANFVERQSMYRLIIQSFEHPEQTVDAVGSDVHNRTKLKIQSSSKAAKLLSKWALTNEK
ncbi:hypothetical protein D1831_12155 [Lactiplantibacillus garii]|uniref:Uncharacterized protein n=1 Tax=Lactiplantibacillus garii TaxID=2306423 RepID=A0A3R8J5I1_9LACO|nr:hypothetical protein [Lactiplantibacillus garii]RRK09541.1 hypothetical protein D1831_12155 [Lactiplantibacillus garii]